LPAVERGREEERGKEASVGETERGREREGERERGRGTGRESQLPKPLPAASWTVVVKLAEAAVLKLM
jgi:hypothetical protein